MDVLAVILWMCWSSIDAAATTLFPLGEENDGRLTPQPGEQNPKEVVSAASFLICFVAFERAFLCFTCTALEMSFFKA